MLTDVACRDHKWQIHSTKQKKWRYYQPVQLKQTIRVSKLLSATIINRADRKQKQPWPHAFRVQNRQKIENTIKMVIQRPKNNASSPHLILSTRKRYFLRSAPQVRLELPYWPQNHLRAESQLPNDSKRPQCSPWYITLSSKPAWASKRTQPIARTRRSQDHKHFAVFSLRHLTFLRHAQWRCFRTAPLDFEEDRKEFFFFFLLLIFEFPPFSLNFFCLRGAVLLPSDESL